MERAVVNMNEIGDGQALMKDVGTEPPATSRTPQEFAVTLENKGFLSLDELLGKGWEDRAVTNNSLEIVEKVGVGRVVEVSPYESAKDYLNEKGQDLGDFL